MRSNSLKIQQAALSIDEFIEQPRPQQPWLLTYLDVFVLIIMLVVTLLTLSNFESKEKATLQQTSHNKTQKQDSQDKLLIENISPTPLSIAPLSPDNSSAKLEQPAYKKLTADSKKKNIQPKEINQKQAQLPEEEIAQTEISKQSQPSIDNQQDKELLQQKLSKTVDELGLTDSVKMKVTLGYAQLEIQDKVLFDSSKAKLLNAGESLLKKLAPLLEQSLGLIYIEGHTDNRPIKTRRYPSNWELGAARATSVLHYLVSQKLDSSRLRAITYADTKPLADNTTKEGRGKNRRVSIIIKVSDKVD